MDRNQIIGLVLISILLILYFQYFVPAPEPVEETDVTEQTQKTDSIQQETQPTIVAQPDDTPADVPDSLRNDMLSQLYGPFAPFAEGDESLTLVENDQVKLWFSNQGGVIKKVELKNFHTHSKDPLILMDETSSRISLRVPLQNNNVDLSSLYYDLKQSKSNDTTRLSYSVKLPDGRSVIHSYRIPDKGFRLLYDLELNGLESQLSGDATFEWMNRMKALEKDLNESRLKSTITYYTSDGDFDDLGERSLDLEEDQVNNPVKWIGFKQQFFTSSIISNGYFRNSLLRTSVDEFDPLTEKVGYALLNIPADEIKQNNTSFTYFFGPNNYQVLKKITPGFSKNIYLGWPPVNFVNKFLIIPIFNFLENYIGNYGIIIIILVLVIKLLLSPLSYKSYVSMAKTKVLKPELDAIKEKHGGDMQKAQQDQMKLYQQVGVNPLSGCIPLVLQMPILFAMFYFFPNSIELRQESFLWADDLSTYDSILDLPFTIPLYGDHVSLFTLLMTASTILYTWSNNQVSTVQGPMKSFTYIMPVIFMFVLNSFPASLSFYYFVSNLVTFGQQAIIRRFVDEEKIKKILDENRLKNKHKKKSKFQLKLEEAMRASEETKKKRK